MKINVLLPILATIMLIGCGGGDAISTSVTGFDKTPITGASPFPLPILDAFFPVTLDVTPDLTKDKLLDWAQKKYSVYFGGDYLDGTYGPYSYRYYPRTGNYIGFDGNDVYLLGPASDGELLYLGPILRFKCEVYTCGTYSVKSTGDFVKDGQNQNYLKGRFGTKFSGAEFSAGPNPFASKGLAAYAVSYPDFSLVKSSCEISFNNNGSVNYTSPGLGTSLFEYEKPSDYKTGTPLNDIWSKQKILRLYKGKLEVTGLTIFEDTYLDIYLDDSTVVGFTNGTTIKQPDGTPTYMYKTFGITWGTFCASQIGYWSSGSTSLFFTDVISKVGAVSGYVGGKGVTWNDINTKIPYDCLRATGPAGSGGAGCRYEFIPN